MPDVVEIWHRGIFSHPESRYLCIETRFPPPGISVTTQDSDTFKHGQFVQTVLHIHCAVRLGCTYHIDNAASCKIRTGFETKSLFML